MASSLSIELSVTQSSRLMVGVVSKAASQPCVFYDIVIEP